MELNRKTKGDIAELKVAADLRSSRYRLRARSHSLTNGRVKATKRYAARMADWLAVWEPGLDRASTSRPPNWAQDEHPASAPRADPEQPGAGDPARRAVHSDLT